MVQTSIILAEPASHTCWISKSWGLPACGQESWEEDLPEPSWSSARISDALSRQRRMRSSPAGVFHWGLTSRPSAVSHSGYVVRNWPSSAGISIHPLWRKHYSSHVLNPREHRTRKKGYYSFLFIRPHLWNFTSGSWQCNKDKEQCCGFEDIFWIMKN